MRTRRPALGELKQLDMSPTTMVFEVSDKAMLDSVKASDNRSGRANLNRAESG